jgi:glycosyltransferase involved in cell wall biosynthesis
VHEPLRIFHLIDKNRLNTGSVVQMLAAAQGLQRRGHRVWVGSRAEGDLETACAKVGLPFFGLPFRGTIDPVSTQRLRRQLRRHRADLVHVHKGRAHAVCLVAAAGLGHSPRLVVNRGVSFELDVFNRWKYRHPRVAAVVCVAEAVREVVIRTTGIERERTDVIHGGTDCELFDPRRSNGASLRNEFGLGGNDLLVGQISVRDWKGWSDLVTAFARVAPTHPQARLLLVGCESGEERSKIERAACDAGLANRVLMLPFRTDMPEVLSACDVVVDASCTGTGITGTIREAMAMERSVVASDCGGNRELVIDGEVGLLVPPRDTDSLAAAVSCLVEDPSLRQRFGVAGRQRVIDHFSTKQRIDKLEALYRRILA